MASNAKDTDFRRKWDTAEYAEKAKKRDAEEAERAKENEERLKQGVCIYFLILLAQMDWRLLPNNQESAHERVLRRRTSRNPHSWLSAANMI